MKVPHADSTALATLACVLEVTARKPGNVHRHRDFDDCGYVDFLAASAAVGPYLSYKCVRGSGVGAAVVRAVEAATSVVRSNTHLGIILLLAPLAGASDGGSLRANVAALLERLTVDDAREVYRAIRTARPAGLGRVSDQDVTGEPSVTLRDAMRLAAERDLVARQYVNDYAEVFEIVVPAMGERLSKGSTLEEAIIASHITLLAARPDSLIARKCGTALASEASRRAAEVMQSGWPDAPESAARLAAFDAWLRADGRRRNPGTTADLVAAGIYAALYDGTIVLPRDWRRDFPGAP